MKEVESQAARFQVVTGRQPRANTAQPFKAKNDPSRSEKIDIDSKADIIIATRLYGPTGTASLTYSPTTHA